MDEILGDRPVTSVSNVLMGAMPGLQVTGTSGQPGAATVSYTHLDVYKRQAIYFCNNSGFIFYAVLLETTQEETTLKENEEKYKKIIFVLKNIRIPIRSGLIIKEERCV